MRSLITVLILLTAAHGQAKIQAQSGMDQIMRLFSDSKRHHSAQGEALDISMACMGIVYLEWFENYHKAIVGTPTLSTKELESYPKFEKTAVLVETRDFELYEMARENMVAEARRIRSEFQSNDKFTPGMASLALDNIQEKALVQNLKDCANPEYLTVVNAKAPLLFGVEDEFTVKPVVIENEEVDVVEEALAGLTLVETIVNKKEIVDEDFLQKTQSYGRWLREIQIR